MTPYSIAGWENFLIAEVGASAALLGLVFVAISINLARIISLPLSPDGPARLFSSYSQC
jgi:hypothetical protein